MPSYVIHAVAGEVLLRELEKEYEISKSKKDLFRAGNITVDSTPKTDSLDKNKITKLQYGIFKQREKQATHFRDEEDDNKFIQAPNLNKFIKKYGHLLDSGNVQALAYLFHLFLDRNYFKDLILKNFAFLDEDYNEAVYIEDCEKGKSIKYIKDRNKKDAKIYRNDEFFNVSDTGIYLDYTLINKYILQDYNLENLRDILLDLKDKNFSKGKIEEIDLRKVKSIIEESIYYIDKSYKTNEEMHILNVEMCEKLIDDSVKDFMRKYGDYIDKSFM